MLQILRVCQFPDMSKVTVSYNMSPRKPKILAKKVKHHQGSIYCVSWNTLGTVIATGSNDHTVKCIQWLSDQSVFGESLSANQISQIIFQNYYKEFKEISDSIRRIYRVF